MLGSVICRNPDSHPSSLLQGQKTLVIQDSVLFPLGPGSESASLPVWTSEQLSQRPQPDSFCEGWGPETSFLFVLSLSLSIPASTVPLRVWGALLHTAFIINA